MQKYQELNKLVHDMKTPSRESAFNKLVFEMLQILIESVQQTLESVQAMVKDVTELQEFKRDIVKEINLIERSKEPEKKAEKPKEEDEIVIHDEVQPLHPRPPQYEEPEDSYSVDASLDVIENLRDILQSEMSNLRGYIDEKNKELDNKVEQLKRKKNRKPLHVRFADEKQQKVINEMVNNIASHELKKKTKA